MALLEVLAQERHLSLAIAAAREVLPWMGGGRMGAVRGGSFHDRGKIAPCRE